MIIYLSVHFTQICHHAPEIIFAGWFQCKRNTVFMSVLS